MTRYKFHVFPQHASQALSSMGAAVETGAEALRETSRDASRAVAAGSRTAVEDLRRRNRAAERRVMAWAAGDPAVPRPLRPALARTGGLWKQLVRIRPGSRRLAALAAAASLVLGGAVTSTASAAQPHVSQLRAESVEGLQASHQHQEPEPQGGDPAEAGGTGSTQPAEQPADQPPAPDPGPAEPAPSVPLDDMQITSDFGMRYTFGTEFHTGTDFSAVTGTPVKAARAGTVVYAHWHYEGGGGLRVVVDHGDGHQSTYNHLSDIYVEEGQYVEFNQWIGAVGSTGNSTGPHLHFEVLFNGEYVDPMAWLAS